MRLSIIAALGALALSVFLMPGVDAAPTHGRTFVDTSEPASPLLQDARYTVRCHNVRVWRHGRRVWVRRCYRHYY
ncbi:MAG TPA: hypothetical protein VKB68_20720 [Stellaceae bacterium]|nr:hypothetical protein [Stellaceae bacterium]